MRNELEKFVGNTILFSGTIKDFNLTDPDINMDNNIIDNKLILLLIITINPKEYI